MIPLRPSISSQCLFDGRGRADCHRAVVSHRKAGPALRPNVRGGATFNVMSLSKFLHPLRAPLVISVAMLLLMATVGFSSSAAGAEEPSATCSATVVGDDLRLDWTRFSGNAFVRADGNWFSSEGTATSLTIADAADDDTVWSVRLRKDGGLQEAMCVRGATPPPPDGPCVVIETNFGVQVAWDVGDIRVNIRRNGSWIRTVDAGISAVGFFDSTTADNYEIVIRPDGVKTTIPCT